MNKKLFLKNAFKYRKYGRIIIWAEWTTLLCIVSIPLFVIMFHGVADEDLAFMSSQQFMVFYPFCISALFSLIVVDNGSALLWRILPRDLDAEERYKAVAHEFLSKEIRRNEEQIADLKKEREEIMLQ